MPLLAQYASSASFTNSLPLSVSTPRSGNGIASRRRSSASTTKLASRTSSATHSVQPVAMSDRVFAVVASQGDELVQDAALLLYRGAPIPPDDGLHQLLSRTGADLRHRASFRSPRTG